MGDTELRVSVGVVREVAPCSLPHLQSIADALAAEATVAELLIDEAWTTS